AHIGAQRDEVVFNHLRVGLCHKQFIGQRDLSYLLPRQIVFFQLSHDYTALFRFFAFAMKTNPLSTPGMPPSTTSSFFSASALMTRRFCTVVTSPPIRPAFFCPGRQRPGVERIPQEPPWR